jgi:N-acetylmuramoyl-L-alanine amidase
MAFITMIYTRIKPALISMIIRFLRRGPLLLSGALFILTGCASTIQDTSHSFRTVVIDAGHGGYDSGTVSRSGRLEKNATLDVATRLSVKLRAAGFRTVLTRDGDFFVPLNERARISNAQRNAIFVSVHFNDSRSRRSHGIETYYNSRYAERIADEIQNSVLKLPGTLDRGVRHANYRVLRLAQYPAVLVECGFFSNRAEASRCATSEYRDDVATKIADAIIVQRYGESRLQSLATATPPAADVY